MANTLPTPIDNSQIAGLRGDHEDWHDELHTKNNLIFTGTGTPEGNQAAPVGALFLRTDGAADTTLYTKETGTGTAGWSALAGVP